MFIISTRNFPPDIGGIQSLMEGLAKALLSHGPVKIFADSFPESEKYDKNSNLEIERLSGFKIFRKYRKANLIHDFIKNNNVRAIFFDHWKSLENLNENVLNNTPTFCLVHSKEINHPLDTHLNKRMLKSLNKARYVIANSHFTKNLAISLGVKNNNIYVIHPGSNYPVNIKEEYNQKAREIYGDSFPKIITVARLDKRKNHQNVLMCIKNLKSKFPKIKYISIGDGDERKNLEQLKNELDLKKEVDLFPQTSEHLKVALLNNSDLFLMPSIIHKKSVEGFGISFIEASCYGKGSIGGKDGGEKDAIQDSKTGYICDGNNLDSIHESILKFFENDNYKKFGINALEFSKNFKWNKIVKKYLELI
jgi:phosphatidylinositol alpha-1,6-mannosyltransferase